MNNEKAIDLAEQALKDSGVKELPKVHGVHYNKEGELGQYTGDRYPEKWTVYFKIEGLPEGFDDILSVIVYPDGKTEIPDIL
ncbi:hypothetical protein [Zooshikella sp. RANM57]|uniref:hypothetical protein n=1 Tax=Zooshikella sp. RANM57 TaxID=3425863 RepID=UPI003D6E7F26